MRTHEERMAEIHRRSEKLIKLRKKRRIATLLTCIPLILCVGIVSGLFLKGGGPTESMTEMETIRETIAVTDLVSVVETATEFAPYSDYEGVSVEILSVEQDNGKTMLRVLWKNETEKDVLFGASFFVDTYRQEQWETCRVNESVVFPAIAYTLSPGQERQEEYTLTGVYELPEEGICRFRTECFVYETSEESLHCQLWDVFEMK